MLFIFENNVFIGLSHETCMESSVLLMRVAWQRKAILIQTNETKSAAIPKIKKNMNLKDNIGLIDEKEIGRHDFGHEVLSNLPLQMTLYFNAIFAPFWSLILILYLRDNYDCFSDFYKFITATIIATVFLIELLRLYLGYRGNLGDKIPELAAFWMLSLLIQFPLQGFLLFNPYFNLAIIEVVTQALMFSMLCMELFAGYYALKFSATRQTEHFREDSHTMDEIRERFRAKEPF